jgi:ankyrin repeat protein
LYIELAKRLGLGLDEAKCPSSLPKQNSLKTSLREVSSLAKNEHIPEKDKNAFDLAREGNINKLKHYSSSHDLSELKDENGMTLMHWACDRGHADLVSYLLTFKKIGFIDEQDSEGNTALHLAYWADHKECIDILSSNHANPYKPNLDGETFANLTSTA